MSWTVQTENLPQCKGRRLVFPFDYAEVLELWKNRPDFRVFFGQQLSEHPFRAIAWETPSVSRATLNQEFECVVIDSPKLAAVKPNPNPFSSYLKSEDEVVIFPNLGRDALLVVPTRAGPLENYTHLAGFLRGAPESQKHRFWERLAEAVKKRLGNQPIWVSTAGLGVHWLHGRVCNTPKYYRHQAYL